MAPGYVPARRYKGQKLMSELGIDGLTEEDLRPQLVGAAL